MAVAVAAREAGPDVLSWLGNPVACPRRGRPRSETAAGGWRGLAEGGEG